MFRTVRKISHKIVTLVRPTYERDQLYDLLGHASADMTLSARVEWLEKLMLWVRTASQHAHEFDKETGQLHNVRLKFLLHLLDRNPEWKKQSASILRSLIEQTSALNLFTQVGLGQQHGFMAEAADIFLRRILPRPSENTELSELFVRIFEDGNDAIWVRHVPSALLKQIIDLVHFGAPPSEKVFAQWQRDTNDSLLILGMRIGSLGTLPEVRGRARIEEVHELPFIRLNHSLQQLAETSRSGGKVSELADKCLRETYSCRRQIREIYLALEESGVNVALVYILENLIDATHRVDFLVKLLRPADDERPILILQFLSKLVEERLSQKTFTDLVRTNTRLLSRKIIERAGATGEHYITSTRGEYFQMIRKGLGGGVMMIGTTLVKFSIMALGAPLFIEGLFFSLNYSFFFSILQLLGFTLATKQPSATASAFGGKLRALEEDGEVREFVDEACRMTRSQFAALVGNLLLLVPVAIMLDMAIYFSSGHHFIGTGTAQHVLQSVNPIESFTIFTASLTGLHLFLSSLTAGWFENWIVFRRIPEGISTNRRLIQVFGEKGAGKMGKWLLNNATLLAGNISLGFLLGFTPIAGKFLGLPLDVRHVTLSACQLTFALCTLATSVSFHWRAAALPIIGIFIIGALNFAVSYSLAFAVAVRARDVRIGVVRRLLKAMRVRLRNKPGQFFLPPRKRGRKVTRR